VEIGVLSAGIKLFVQGTVRAFWDEQRAYTKGTSGKLAHRNAEVCLDEMVSIVSKSKYTTQLDCVFYSFVLILPKYHGFYLA